MRTMTLTAALLAATLALPGVALAARPVSIHKGQTVTAKLDRELDSGVDPDGTPFTAHLEPGLFFDHGVRGDVLEGHLEGVKPAARWHKKGQMHLVFDDIRTPSGHEVPVNVELKSASIERAKGHKLRNFAFIVGSAIAGHEIAKHTGHKHGGLAGAAAASAALFVGKGSDVKIPKGTRFKIKFLEPVDLPD